MTINSTYTLFLHKLTSKFLLTKLLNGGGIFFVLICQTLHLTAQRTPLDERPEENEVLLEKKFIEATRDKILGNYANAIAKYQEVVQLDNENHVANYELAVLYREMEQYDKGLVRASRAVSLDPERILYRTFYADFLAQMGKYDEAAKVFEELSEFHPKNIDVFSNWAAYLIQNQAPDKAIKVYNSLEKNIGIHPVIAERKFHLYLAIDKGKKGVKELEKSLESYPNNIVHLVLLGNYYKDEGKMDDARIYYEKALKLDANQPDANIAMADFFKQKGDTERYLNALNSLFEDPEQAEETKLKVLRPLVEKFDAGKDASNAENLLGLAEKLVYTHPASTEAHQLYGQLLLQLQRFKEAAFEFETALQNDKNMLEVWRGLLTSYAQLHDFQQLAEKSQEFNELYPSQPEGNYYLGWALLKKGDFAGAKKALNKAALMAVTDQQLQAQAKAALAQALAGLADNDSAKQAINEALQLAPDNQEILRAHCRMLLIQNQALDKAEKLLGELMSKSPQDFDHKATKAWLLFRQKDFKAATELYQQLEKIYSSDPELLEQQGDALFKLGKTDQALKYWEKAQKSGRDSKILNRKIETKQLYE